MFSSKPLLPLLLLSAAACQAERGHLPGADFNPAVNSRDPAVLVSLLVSTTTPEASRISADRLLVQSAGKTAETRLSVLEQILYAPGHSDRMRIYALDQLADADPARAGRALILYLPRFEGDVLAHACELAVTLGDVRLIDPLIRSLARSVPPGGGQARLDGHPETSALERLGGRPLLDTLFDRLQHAGDRALRSNALDLAAAIQPADQLKTRIAAIAGPDAWLADLQWWLASFGAAPAGEMEMRWVQVLHRPDNAALVNRALQRHRLLQNESDYLPAPRFVHVLAYIDDAALRQNRSQLLSTIKSQLGDRKVVGRTPQYAGAADDVHPTLDTQEARLSRGDLFAIHLLLEGLKERRVLEELQRQGLADMSDTTSEHGGLLTFQNVRQPALWALPYPPLFANGDFQYVSGDKLLADTPTGAAQYHFHFQQVRNEERAGPGTGDLDYARNTRCNCVVITSVGPGAMDVDYYTPAGAVVDLGIYQVGAP